MAVNFTNESDPKKVAAQQRALIQQKGDQLQTLQQGQSDQQQGISDQYRARLDDIEAPMAEGNGGYSDAEKQAILAQGGMPSALTDEQANANFLTDDEKAGIKGDTGSYTRNFNPDQMSQDQTVSAGRQRGAVSNLQAGLKGAVDNQALSQSDKFKQDSENQIGDNQGQFGTVLSAVGNNVRGAIDPSAVTASGSFLKDYNMSPEERQNIVTGAGISAGAKDAAAVDAEERQARASGASPMGVAAYRSRMARASAADAGDAMTKARIEASNADAARKMSGEQLREQGGQYLTNVKTGTEMGMGQEALAGTQQLGQQALDQRNSVEQQRINAEQGKTAANLNAATTGGNAEVANEANLNAEGRQQEQYNATTGAGIAQAQDAANSSRSGAVAGNRQTTATNNQNTQFNQNKTLNDTGSARATGVANTRLGAQQTGLNYYQGQQAQTNQNVQNDQNREVQTYGTQATGTNQAAGLQEQASQNPGLFSKITGAVTGAVGAAGGGTGLKAMGLADGRQGGSEGMAIVGEDGPEYVGNPHDQKQPWWKGLLTGVAKTGLRAAIPGLPAFADGHMGDGSGSGGGRVINRPTLVKLDSGDSVVPLSYRARAKVRPSAAFGSETVRSGRIPYQGAA